MFNIFLPNTWQVKLNLMAGDLNESDCCKKRKKWPDISRSNQSIYIDQYMWCNTAFL